MKNKNGYTTMQMLIVIAVLGVFTLAMLGATSHAFKDNSEERYDEKVHLIIKQARDYANTLDNLKDDGILIITVNDLINNDYYAPDNEAGHVIDPRNSKANLNGLKIKLTYENDGTITVEVLDEG